MSKPSRPNTRVASGVPASSPSAAAARPNNAQQPKKEEEQATIAGDETRLLVDWHHVGAVIGRGGASVKTIREESGCAINIIAPSPNAPSPQQIDRVMTIKGSTDQTTRAIFLIANTIQQRAQERKKNGQDSGDRSSRAGQEQQDGTTAIKLLVHRAAVGAVIGKGGESIRATQAETGARIQVSSEPLGNSTDKSVTISGTPEVVEAAVHKVLTQLAESPLRAGTKTVNFVPGPAFYDFAADGQQGGQPGPNGMPSGSPQGPISIQKIAIPTICAGCVIGRGGTIIRDLRAQSGTNISIADPDPATPDERVVTICGLSEGIIAAVHLIRQCVEAYEPPVTQEDLNNQQAEEQPAQH